MHVTVLALRVAEKDQLPNRSKDLGQKAKVKAAADVEMAQNQEESEVSVALSSQPSQPKAEVAPKTEAPTTPPPVKRR